MKSVPQENRGQILIIAKKKPDTFYLKMYPALLLCVLPPCIYYLPRRRR